MKCVHFCDILGMVRPDNFNVKEIMQTGSKVALIVGALGVIAAATASLINPEIGIKVAEISAPTFLLGLMGIIIVNGETFSPR